MVTIRCIGSLRAKFRRRVAKWDTAKIFPARKAILLALLTAPINGARNTPAPTAAIKTRRYPPKKVILAHQLIATAALVITALAPLRPENTYTGSGILGEWYLPTLGEMMQLYGYDMSSVTWWTGTGGAKGDVKTKVNTTLNFLASKGVNAAPLTNEYYWTSNEKDAPGVWIISMTNGYRESRIKHGEAYARSCHQF